jgi:tryptophanyl-tRNA synthetase
MSDKIYIVADVEGHLIASKADGKLVLCMFEYLEDAERYLISWGFDPSNFNFFWASEPEKVYKMLNIASEQFDWATMDAPMYKGKEFTVFELKPLVEKMAEEINS